MSDELNLGIMLSKHRMINPVKAKKFLLEVKLMGWIDGDVMSVSDKEAVDLCEEIRERIMNSCFEDAAKQSLS